MISINLLNALDISNDVRHFTGTQYLSDTPSQIGLNYIDVNDGKEYCWWWNIHHLAHKCKEWAWDKNNGMNLSSELTHCSFWWEYKDEIGIRVTQKTFYANTEPEAIFEACQWILDNKDKE